MVQRTLAVQERFHPSNLPFGSPLRLKYANMDHPARNHPCHFACGNLDTACVGTSEPLGLGGPELAYLASQAAWTHIGARLADFFKGWKGDPSSGHPRRVHRVGTYGLYEPGVVGSRGGGSFSAGLNCGP